MKIENSSKLKTWSVRGRYDEATQDLSIACLSFVVLLCVAVADAAFRM